MTHRGSKFGLVRCLLDLFVRHIGLYAWEFAIPYTKVLQLRKLIGFPSGYWSFISIHLLIFSWVMFQQEESDLGLPGGNGQLLTLGFGLLATALAAAYVTRLAKVLPKLTSIFICTIFLGLIRNTALPKASHCLVWEGKYFYPYWIDFLCASGAGCCKRYRLA